jgi:hypothetical protein
VRVRATEAGGERDDHGHRGEIPISGLPERRVGATELVAHRI